MLKGSAALDFDELMRGLKSGQDKEWRWLVRHLRERVVPWIRKKDGRLPSNTIVSESYFIEEVFAESMIKFYEIFPTANFNSLGDIRGLLFKIADLKLKEGYRKVRKDQLLFYPTLKGDLPEEDFGDKEKFEQEQLMVQQLELQLATLSKEEKEILVRYANGEKIKNISADLKIKEEAGRKKKQRAMQKLRTRLQDLIKKGNG